MNGLSQNDKNERDGKVVERKIEEGDLNVGIRDPNDRMKETGHSLPLNSPHHIPLHSLTETKK
jgi:hypothetical protein